LEVALDHLLVRVILVQPVPGGPILSSLFSARFSQILSDTKMAFFLKRNVMITNFGYFHKFLANSSWVKKTCCNKSTTDVVHEKQHAFITSIPPNRKQKEKNSSRIEMWLA
jgi:hypothetical protein